MQKCPDGVRDERWQAYDGSTRTATITTLAVAADGTSKVHIMDSSSIEGVAVMRDAIFLTGGVTTSGARAQNCSFDSATVTEGPPENTHPVTVFECAVVGTDPPTDSANGASKTDHAIAGSTPTDVSFGTLSGTTTWGMYTAAYNGSGALLWTQVAYGGAIFPKAIVVVDPSIGGKPLAGVWGGSVTSKSVASRSQPPDGTSAQDVGSLGLDHAVADGPYVYVAAEISDVTNPTDFGRTRLPLECSKGKTVGEKGASVARGNEVPCSGQVVSQGTTASFPTTPVVSSDIVVVQMLAGSGEVQTLRRTGMSDKSESVSSLAAHSLTGSVYLSGRYYATSVQGQETSSGGDDVFGLNAAKRSDSVGCPRQRWDGVLAMGQTGVPDCKLYSHAASASLGTGFVVKYTFKGDGATGSQQQDAPPAGFLDGTSTYAPCADSPYGADTNGANHVLTGAAACSTHASGCSCVKLIFKSRASRTTGMYADSNVFPHGPGPSSKLSGHQLLVVAGKGAGYAGIISSYNLNAGLYNIIPSIPSSGIDGTSQFQLFPQTRYTPTLHLADCRAADDEGCAAYGIEWAKSVGYAIGGGALSSAWSSGVALVESDSDIYVAGHYSGFQGLWAGYTGLSRTTAPAAGSPSFGVEGVDELIGFDNPTATDVASFLSKLID